jgi:hypothetical protein
VYGVHYEVDGQAVYTPDIMQAQGQNQEAGVEKKDRLFTRGGSIHALSVPQGELYNPRLVG